MVLERPPQQAPALLALVRVILRGQFRGRLASKSRVSLSHQRLKDLRATGCFTGTHANWELQKAISRKFRPRKSRVSPVGHRKGKQLIRASC